MRAKIIFIIFFISISLSFVSAQEWKEIKFNNEVIIIRESENSIKSGQPFARKDETTFLLVGNDLGKIGKVAVEDIQKYLPLASGCKIKIEAGNELKNQKNGFTILLATIGSSKMLNWAKIGYPKDLSKQECLIKPIKHFPDGTQGVALVGGSPRGLLNGLYTLLEKSGNIWWDPVRVLNPDDPLYSNINETTLSHFNELRWEGKDLRWKPVVSERIIYSDYHVFTKKSVDWASRNRLSHFIIATPHKLPMSENDEKPIKSTVKYAQERGLKVFFMNMTHRLPDDMPTLPASSDEAVKASTELYLDQFKRFGLDGMTWHTASEGIHVNMDEAYKMKPRIEWEAKYFNSYYKAIREVNKDAILVMLMGWYYMNPAEKLAKLLPEDVVAWIVPNTPIVDAALTDIDSYNKYFDNIWYWLYVSISRDGTFPMIKLDYLEKYFREAIKQGNSLAPQGVLGNNNENTMYYAQTARDGIIPNREFLKYFGERYYGDSRMGEVLYKYQKALKYHRNWFNNIHTVNINYYLTFEERDYLKEVYRLSLDAAKKAKTPLVKNRLKVLTITSLRCLIRRSISPDGYEKGWTPSLQKMYEKNAEEFIGMINEIKLVFPDFYFGREKDFFWAELLEMERVLNK